MAPDAVSRVCEPAGDRVRPSKKMQREREKNNNNNKKSHLKGTHATCVALRCTLHTTDAQHTLSWSCSRQMPAATLLAMTLLAQVRRAPQSPLSDEAQALIAACETRARAQALFGISAVGISAAFVSFLLFFFKRRLGLQSRRLAHERQHATLLLSIQVLQQLAHSTHRCAAPRLAMHTGARTSAEAGMVGERGGMRNRMRRTDGQGYVAPAPFPLLHLHRSHRCPFCRKCGVAAAARGSHARGRRDHGAHVRRRYGRRRWGSLCAGRPSRRGAQAAHHHHAGDGRL